MDRGPLDTPSRRYLQPDIRLPHSHIRSSPESTLQRYRDCGQADDRELHMHDTWIPNATDMQGRHSAPSPSLPYPINRGEDERISELHCSRSGLPLGSTNRAVDARHKMSITPPVTNTRPMSLSSGSVAGAFRGLELDGPFSHSPSKLRIRSFSSAPFSEDHRQKSTQPQMPRSRHYYHPWHLHQKAPRDPNAVQYGLDNQADQYAANYSRDNQFEDRTSHSSSFSNTQAYLRHLPFNMSVGRGASPPRDGALGVRAPIPHPNGDLDQRTSHTYLPSLQDPTSLPQIMYPHTRSNLISRRYSFDSYHSNLGSQGHPSGSRYAMGAPSRPSAALPVRNEADGMLASNGPYTNVSGVPRPEYRGRELTETSEYDDEESSKTDIPPGTIACMVPGCARLAKGGPTCLLHSRKHGHSVAPSSRVGNLKASDGSTAVHPLPSSRLRSQGVKSPQSPWSETCYAQRNSQLQAKRCNIEGCVRLVNPKSTRCTFHGGSADRKCQLPGCKSTARSRGLCYAHGGGRRCQVLGCKSGAVSNDLCKRHGGGRRCTVKGCKSSSESRGLCYAHGGGRRCALPTCLARARKGGLCTAHSADSSPSTALRNSPASSSSTVLDSAMQDRLQSEQGSAASSSPRRPFTERRDSKEGSEGGPTQSVEAKEALGSDSIYSSTSPRGYVLAARTW